MHILLVLALLVTAIFLLTRSSKRETREMEIAGGIRNPKLASFTFLRHLLNDNHYPRHLIEKGQKILVQMCLEIEVARPENEVELFEITHKATRRFNALETELDNEGSELETVARDHIAEDVAFILDAYDFEADLEEALGPRTW